MMVFPRKFYRGGHRLQDKFQSVRSPSYVSNGWKLQESPRFGGVFGKRGKAVTFIPYSRLLRRRR